MAEQSKQESPSQTSQSDSTDELVPEKTLTRVALIGRPNVGKSTLFNIISESRKALVKDQPGVTRDVQVSLAEVWGKDFEIVDTGGLTDSEDPFAEEIKKKVRVCLRTVDLIIVVMDGRSGLCPEDRDVYLLAKSTGLPFLIVVNKLDSEHEREVMMSEFFEFGNELVGAAFEQRSGLAEILEWLHPRLDSVKLEERTRKYSMAIVGRPNVGKSSLCNRLLGEERMLVSNIAGTTVDAIYSEFTYRGRPYRLVDTAGLRKKGRREAGVESLSTFKTDDAIAHSDLVLLMIDGVEGPSEQDAKILDKILTKHKGVVVAINKVDIAEHEVENFRKKTRERMEMVFHFFPEVPTVFISAKTGFGVDKLFQTMDEIWHKLNMRISTSQLNQFFLEVIRLAPSPVYRTKDVKFFYLTQTKQTPPSFIAFANFPEGVDNSYRRFLAKQIKQKWDLHGIPIRIFVMKKRRS